MRSVAIDEFIKKQIIFTTAQAGLSDIFLIAMIKQYSAQKAAHPVKNFLFIMSKLPSIFYFSTFCTLL